MCSPCWRKTRTQTEWNVPMSGDRMPTALEIPEIEIGHIETPSPLNALGIKGVGEAGAIPVPALVAEAIDDALAPLGVRVREMPLDPDRLRRLIDQARGSSVIRGG